ncbi:MAG: cytochrome C [Deltaproteobacteria bacterium]
MNPIAAAAALLLAATSQAQTPDASVTAPKAPAAHATDTKCSACHTPDGWGDVKFVHERTGFPLTGAHARVACRKCHVGDFKEPLARSCSGCHRDIHGGYAGVQCASCHDTEGWKSKFDADAHRRTNFPLQGRHALLPCEQCHGDRRDRSFARSTVPCWECHQTDLATASAKGVDHSGFAGYPQLACLGCHGFWRWSPATLNGHGTCFPINSGRHSGIACLSCHVTLPVPLVIGSCTSVPYPDCIRCHSCAKHPQTQGFVCANQNCYGCHYDGKVNGNAAPTQLRSTPMQKRVKP